MPLCHIKENKEKTNCVKTRNKIRINNEFKFSCDFKYNFTTN